MIDVIEDVRNEFKVKLTDKFEIQPIFLYNKIYIKKTNYFELNPVSLT